MIRHIHSLTAVLVLFILVGCSQLHRLGETVVHNPVVQDIEAFGKGVVARDWKVVHDSGLRLQDAYVVLSGAKTLKEEYGAECSAALSLFYVSPDIGSIRIVRDSKLIDVIEKVGTLRSINAMTIGPRVIHVGKGKVLNAPHEVAHTQQWVVAEETFPLQYLPTVILLNRSGYEMSVFEQDARMVAAEFQKQYGPVCDDPV